CTAGLVSKCTCQIAFTCPCASGDQNILSLLQVKALGQPDDLFAIQLSVGIEVDFFDHSLIAESCIPQPPCSLAIVSVIVFSIHKMSDELIRCKAGGAVLFYDCFKGQMHAIQFHLL